MKGIEIKDERGFILILALVTMVAMTVIGLSLMMNITVDMQLSKNEREMKQAFQLAEGGIQEAMARLHLSPSQGEYIGEDSADANYRTTAWNSGNSLGKNFGIGVGGDRESADSLNYTVTIEYLDETNSEGFCDSNDVTPNVTSPPASCDNDPAEVVLFGQDFNIAASLTDISYGNQPVYKVSSTGTSGNTSRTIEAYIGASALNTDTEYGLNTNSCITANGASNNIGPVLQGPGCGCVSIIGGCATNKTAGDVATTYDMQFYLGDDIADIIDMADEKHWCLGANCSGTGPPVDDIGASGAIDTIVVDWGDPTNDTYSTLIYIDNPGKEASLTGTYTGRGILIVTGDLKISGDFTYEGLIYVFGTLTFGGGGSSLNVTGGVMANNAVTTNGGITITYDQATLDAVAKENSSSALLIWKRL